jgi:hypothetical protein
MTCKQIELIALTHMQGGTSRLHIDSWVYFTQANTIAGAMINIDKYLYNLVAKM